MSGDDRSDRWEKIERLLDELLDLDDDIRSRRLAELLAREPGLHREVSALLEADRRAGGVLDEPIPELVGDTDALDVGAVDAAARVGSRIDVYRLIELIGRGGMGEVYRAERTDGEFEHTVAVKMIRTGMGTEDNLRRFRQERQILARLTHPAITRLLDGGVTEEGRPYLVMELVTGSPLIAHADRHRLPVADRLRLFDEVCAAVGYAHRHLVVHRDLKPSNVLVTGDGKVKLLDFGIAKLVEDDADPGLTRVGTFVLTPDYAAPEQVRDEPITTATDVFALGVILYELLSGARPHRITSSSRRDLEIAIVETDPDPLPDAIDRDLALIVFRALAKSPEERYPTADALRDDLRRHRDGLPISARAPSVRYRLGKFVRRNRVSVIAAALVLLALVAGLAATAWQAQVARREAVRATLTRDLLLEIFGGADPDAAPGTLSATDVLRRGMEKVDARLEDDPGLHAEMLHTIGRLLNELGDPAAAEGLLARSVELRRAHGSAHELAESLDELGTAALYLDRHAEAESLYTLALATLPGGASDPHRPRSLNNLAVVLTRDGRYDEAIATHRESIHLDRARHGDEHEEVATDLSNLAVTYSAAGREAEADSLHRMVLAMRRRLHPGDHTEIAASLHNLADVQSNLSRPESCLVYIESAIAMKRRLLEPDHPSLLRSLRVRGRALSELRRLDEADAQLQEVLEATLRRDPDGSEAANTWNDLGILAFQRGDYPLARERIAAAVTIYERILGPDHATVATLLGNVATLDRLQGDLPAAEAGFRRVLEIHRAQLGHDNAQVVLDLNNLGSALRDQGDGPGAVSWHREALATAERIWPDGDHDLAALTWSNLAGSLRLTGGYEEADRLARRAIAYLEPRRAEEDPRLISARTILGRVTVARGSPREALPLLEKTLAHCTDANGPEHGRTGQVLVAVGECQAALGDRDTAIETLTAAHRILDDAGHPDAVEAGELLARVRAGK